MVGKRRESDELRDAKEKDGHVTQSNSNENTPNSKRLRRSDNSKPSSTGTDDEPDKVNSKDKSSPKITEKGHIDAEDQMLHFTTDEVACIAESMLKIFEGNKEKQRTAELNEISQLRKALGVKKLEVKNLVEELTGLEEEHGRLQTQIRSIVKLTHYE